jgi:hypothetical protein
MWLSFLVRCVILELTKASFHVAIFKTLQLYKTDSIKTTILQFTAFLSKSPAALLTAVTVIAGAQEDVAAVQAGVANNRNCLFYHF